MANLLPITTQRKLFSRTLVRMSGAGAVLLALVSFIGAFALVPGYLMLHTQKEALSYELGIRAAGVATQAQTDRDELNATNKRLKIIAGFESNDQHIGKVIRSVVDKRPGGMVIRRMSYDSTVSGTSTRTSFTVSAVSKNREDQTTYFDRLKLEPFFSLVEIPISALALTDQRAITFIAHGNF